jgi:hypothetical protein
LSIRLIEYETLQKQKLRDCFKDELL